MTTGEMIEYTNRFKGIMSMPDSYTRDVRLASLMTDLEGYGIPMFGKERIVDFENHNPFVMRLYRTVSESRVF